MALSSTLPVKLAAEAALSAALFRLLPSLLFVYLQQLLLLLLCFLLLFTAVCTCKMRMWWKIQGKVCKACAGVVQDQKHIKHVNRLGGWGREWERERKKGERERETERDCVSSKAVRWAQSAWGEGETEGRMMFISRAKNSCLAQGALERFLVFGFCL